jgi:hypothetical protein
MSTPLPDGTYDAFVVDVETDDDGAAVGLELTIVSGERKGDVLGVSAAGLTGGLAELMGMPATLQVTDGAPSVTIES